MNKKQLLKLKKLARAAKPFGEDEMMVMVKYSNGEGGIGSRPNNRKIKRYKKSWLQRMKDRV